MFHRLYLIAQRYHLLLVKFFQQNLIIKFFLDSTQPPFAIIEPTRGILFAQKRLAPIFPQTEINIEVEENDQNMQLYTFSAKYPDEQPGTITYIIEFGDTSLFRLNIIFFFCLKFFFT